MVCSALWLFVFLLSSPDVTDPGPHGEQPGDEQAERYGHLFEQLHDDAGLSTFRLPVCRLQRPVIVLVQEEQRLAAGNRLEHLEQQRGGGALRHYLLLPKGEKSGMKMKTRFCFSVSYLSQFRGRISLGVRIFEWVKLRQHHLPLLVVDEDHLFLLLLLLLLLFFIISSLSLTLLNLFGLFFSLPLNCSSICSRAQR